MAKTYASPPLRNQGLVEHRQGRRANWTMRRSSRPVLSLQAMIPRVRVSTPLCPGRTSLPPELALLLPTRLWDLLSRQAPIPTLWRLRSHSGVLPLLPTWVTLTMARRVLIHTARLRHHACRGQEKFAEGLRGAAPGHSPPRIKLGLPMKARTRRTRRFQALRRLARPNTTLPAVAIPRRRQAAPARTAARVRRAGTPRHLARTPIRMMYRRLRLR